MKNDPFYPFSGEVFLESFRYFFFIYIWKNKQVFHNCSFLMMFSLKKHLMKSTLLKAQSSL